MIGVAIARGPKSFVPRAQSVTHLRADGASEGEFDVQATVKAIGIMRGVLHSPCASFEPCDEIETWETEFASNLLEFVDELTSVR